MNEADKALEAVTKAEQAADDAVKALLLAAEEHQGKAQAAQDNAARIAQHKDRIDRFDKVRSEAQAAVAETEAAHAAAKAAFDAARDSIDDLAINGVAKSELAALRKTLDGPTRDLVAAATKLAEAKAALKLIERMIAEETKLLKEASGKTAALERDAERTDAAKAAAQSDSDDAQHAVDGALKDLAKALAAPVRQPISAEVLKLLSRAGQDRGRDFLTIATRDDGLDKLVRSALAELEQQMDAVVSPADARDALVEAGVATKVAMVTNRLSRSRLSPIRRAILSRSYAPLLLRRLGPKKKIDVDVAEDTVGLADTVLADLAADNGPLDIFSAMLAKRAVADMAIDAPDGSPQRALITAQLRGSL